VSDQHHPRANLTPGKQPRVETEQKEGWAACFVEEINARACIHTFIKYTYIHSHTPI